jgi:hypothetical protein
VAVPLPGHSLPVLPLLHTHPQVPVPLPFFFSGTVRLPVPVLQLSIQMDSSYPRTLLVCQSTVLLLALRTTGV